MYLYIYIGIYSRLVGLIMRYLKLMYKNIGNLRTSNLKFKINNDNNSRYGIQCNIVQYRVGQNRSSVHLISLKTID